MRKQIIILITWNEIQNVKKKSYINKNKRIDDFHTIISIDVVYDFLRRNWLFDDTQWNGKEKIGLSSSIKIANQ